MPGVQPRQVRTILMRKLWSQPVLLRTDRGGMKRAMTARQKSPCEWSVDCKHPRSLTYDGRRDPWCKASEVGEDCDNVGSDERVIGGKRC